MRITDARARSAAPKSPASIRAFASRTDEAKLLDGGLRRARLVERGREQRDRRLQRARHGIGPAERVDGSRVGEQPAVPRLQGLLEQVDRLVEALGAKRDLPEPGERRAPRGIPRIEMGAKLALGLVHLAEAEGDLCLHELDLDDSRLDAGGEPLTGHVEPERELVDHLQRRHPGPRLDPRDVGGRAARKCELPLGEGRPLARRSEAGSDGLGGVDVGGQ